MLNVIEYNYAITSSVVHTIYMYLKSQANSSWTCVCCSPTQCKYDLNLNQIYELVLSDFTQTNDIVPFWVFLQIQLISGTITSCSSGFEPLSSCCHQVLLSQQTRTCAGSYKHTKVLSLSSLLTFVYNAIPRQPTNSRHTLINSTAFFVSRLTFYELPS